MAQIGTFTRRADGSYIGKLRTLMIRTELTIRPSDRDNDKPPDHRAWANGVECGVGWTKPTRDDATYISLKLDDPSLTSPIYASLVEGDGEHRLIWSR